MKFETWLEARRATPGEVPAQTSDPKIVDVEQHVAAIEELWEGIKTGVKAMGGKANSENAARLTTASSILRKVHDSVSGAIEEPKVEPRRDPDEWKDFRLAVGRGDPV